MWVRRKGGEPLAFSHNFGTVAAVADAAEPIPGMNKAMMVLLPLVIDD